MSTEAALGREPTAAEFAEAAAWMARLHGPHHSLQVERGFRRWLQANAAHAAAFEAMTATWEVTGKIPAPPFAKLSRWQRAGYREGFIRSAAAVAAVALLTVAALFYSHYAAIATGIGEQRTMTLGDGTRVILNTDTRIQLKFSDRERRVLLENGEALFEVAPQAGRPFVVGAGERSIRALGTVFLVRRDARRLAVTLLEGKVAVESAAGEGAGPQASILAPGQRLLFAGDRPPSIDQPALEKVTAWRRGLVDFDNTTLGEAAADMNRYSASRLVIEQPQAAQIHINGVFRTGDNASFAAAVARAYRLGIRESDGEIHLTGVPAGAGMVPAQR